MDRQLCFVLMPFGIKPDANGTGVIDFNTIYEEALRPGIEDAGLTAIRADEEELGGIIHLAMFERLLLCEYAVADLTTSNPNVLYELGIRHAARPWTTLSVYAAQKPLPFDVAQLRTQPYTLGENNTLTPEAAATLRKQVSDHLREIRRLRDVQDTTDSPLFQLISAWRPPQLPEAAASTFRQQARNSESWKSRLADAREMAGHEETRKQGEAELKKVRGEVRRSGSVDAGVLTGILLTYRDFGAWALMIEFYNQLPQQLKRQINVRQLLAFAYNRRAEDVGNPLRVIDRRRALDLLDMIDEEQGPTSESLGLRGRVHKSHWRETFRNGDHATAAGLLRKALQAYMSGFEADWRDYYPGVNALTLLDVQGTSESLAEKERLLPVVSYSLERWMSMNTEDYWALATLLEISVLDNLPERAKRAKDDALLLRPKPWMRSSTADNLRDIQRARDLRGAENGWLKDIIESVEPRPVDDANAHDGE